MRRFPVFHKRLGQSRNPSSRAKSRDAGTDGRWLPPPPPRRTGGRVITGILHAILIPFGKATLKNGNSVCTAHFHEAHAAAIKGTVEAVQKAVAQLRVLKGGFQLHGHSFFCSPPWRRARLRRAKLLRVKRVLHDCGTTEAASLAHCSASLGQSGSLGVTGGHPSEASCQNFCRNFRRNSRGELAAWRKAFYRCCMCCIQQE